MGERNATPWHLAVDSSRLRNYKRTSYAAFKASSPVVDGQAGAEERIELESAVPRRNRSLLS